MFTNSLLRTIVRRHRLHLDFFQLSRRELSSITTPSVKDGPTQLFSTRVTFNPHGEGNGETYVHVDAVYQDTSPAGSTVGTVVCLHGCPGSHKDFKYITPLLAAAGIRVLALNFPGFGHSQDLPTLVHNNVERNAFVQALLDGLAVEKNVIFMGHSRGSENALKLTVMNQERSVAAVMLNAPGLRIHRGIRPFSVIENSARIYDAVPFLRTFFHVLLTFVYNNIVGLRLSDGRVAINSIKTMRTTALHKQKPFLDKVNKSDHLRVLYCYAGNDFLIETDIQRECAAYFHNRQHFIVSTPDAAEEEDVTKRMRKAFVSDDRDAVTVEFATDGHFLQKFRAAFVANGILAMLEAHRKTIEQL